MFSVQSLNVKKGVVYSKKSFESADLVKNNIEDITLYSWVMDRIERGFGYDLKKFIHNWCVDPTKVLFGKYYHDICTFKTFLLALISSIMDFFDLYKDLTLVIVFSYFSSQILVSFV